MPENHYTLGSEQGLPNLQVHKIAIDRYERLWIAGPSGLSCYNGTSIKVYDSRNGLQCVGLRTIKIQNEHLIWLGTDRGIELITIDGIIVPLQYDFTWTFGIVECFLFHDSFIWAGTSYGLLKLKYIDEKLVLIENFEYGLIEKLKVLKNSILILSAKLGLMNFKDGILTNFTDQLPKNIRITCFKETIDKQILIGTTEGLFITNHDGALIGHFFSEIPGKITGISIIAEKWVIAFANSIQLLHQPSLEIVDLETFHINGGINYLLSDIYGNIWVATNNAGIKKISILRNAIQKLDSGSEEAVFSVRAVNGEKELLLGGEGYFSRLAKKENEDIPILKDYSSINSIIWDTILDPKDPTLVWLATQDGIYKKRNNSALTKDVNIAKIIKIPTRVLLVVENKIFIGTISGLFCIEDGVAVEIYSSSNLKFGYVYSLSLSNSGEIWVSTLGQGLWMQTNIGFKNIIDGNLTTNGNTYCTQTNSAGETIVLQQENVVLLNKNLESQIILKEFPIGGWTVIWIDDHNIAVGTDTGLNIINIHSQSLPKKINLYLEKSKWQSTSSRSLMQLVHNKIYYGQISGFYLIDLNILERYQNLPPVRLDSCNWLNTQPKLIKNIYYVTPGKWVFNAVAYCTWYIDERQIQFRFKLAGFDKTWSQLSDNNTITFNSLPTGNYELLVQAFTPITGYSGAVSLIKIVVKQSIFEYFHSLIRSVNYYFKFQNVKVVKNKLLLEQNELFKKEIEERIFAETKLNKYKEDLENLIFQRTGELLKEKDKAEFADRQKTMFLASMSHEIRTPLSGIIGLVDLMGDTNLDKLQQEYKVKIANTSKHLLELINNILDVTKIEAGQMELEYIPFSILILLDEIAELAQLRLEKKSINIIIDESIKTRHLIIGDPLRLKQILLNLMSNALKFTNEGNVVLVIKELETNSSDIILQFLVTDTGIGMNEEQLEHVFQPFKQGDESTARQYGGSGLGLNICQNYVSMMDGLLTAKSQPGEGSTFEFTLNFKKDIHLDVNFQTEKLSEELLSKKILVLNNTPYELAVIRRQLKNLGISPKAINSQSIKDADLDHRSFDLVIVDWGSLKVGEQEEFLKFKNNFNPTAKFIILNSFKDFEFLKIMDHAKVDMVLEKPISQRVFRKSIVECFNNLQTPNSKFGTNLLSENQKRLNSKYHILIAEDDKTNQLVSRKIFEREGYIVSIASNGQECIEYLKIDKSYSMIFMDIQMPVMGGIAATRYIREELKLSDIPIIALTADVTLEMKKVFNEIGVNGYLLKPINIPEVNAIFSKYLHNS